MSLNIFKKKTRFMPHYLEICRQIEAGEILTRQGDSFSPATVANYLSVANRIKEYERDTGTIYIEDMDADWADRLTLYLMGRGYSRNSIGSYVSAVKSNLRRLFRKGIGTQTGEGFVRTAELTTAVYSSIEDIQALLACDLSDRPGLSRIRHIYVLHCFLGLRISDLFMFLSNPRRYMREIGGKMFVEMKTRKTGEVVVIPLAKVALQVLSMYNYDFGEPFSCQYYNAMIKEAARMSDITDEIVTTRTQGGVRVDTPQPKCDLMSSHTARRTFATNAFLAGLPEKSIMLITGHKSATSFHKYIRCTSLDSAIRISGHHFFNVELPITELLEGVDIESIEDESQKNLL